MTPQEKLKKLRKSKNLTTQALGDLIGLPQSTISKIENGKRSFDFLIREKLAEALQVEPSFFLEDAEEDTTNFNSTNTLEQDLTEDYNNIMNKIRNNNGGALFFNGVNLEGENMELFEDALKVALKAIHLKSKAKSETKATKDE